MQLTSLGQKILLAFEGKDHLPPAVREAIRLVRPGGFTLFSSLNVDSPAQVRHLTQMLQQAAKEEDLPPFLIGVDQEGGQLMAIGAGATPLPGNLALGAAGSPDLARQAGQVLGRELAALGINLDYAPCCDVNSNPHNPVIGTRSFGEDPGAVAGLTAAMIQGIQSSGVAATAKHFPGHGDTSRDSHYGLPRLAHSLERLRQVEFPPFQAAVQAGARLVMTGHLALPTVQGRDDLPATLSPEILEGLLRGELGFEGVIVTDAMDMRAIQQGQAFSAQVVQAAAAGADLLLLTTSLENLQRAYQALEQARQTGRLQPEGLEKSLARVAALKTWLGCGPLQPDLSLVGCAAHRAVAQEIAARSITLVRDRAGLLPLRPEDTPRLAVILFQPSDLTPADTSSHVQHSLAQALRSCYPQVDELILPYAPQEADIAGVLARLRPVHGGDPVPYQAVILGTMNAYDQPGQAALVQAVLQTGLRVVVAALRMPYDLAAFPRAPVYLCTYSILEPSMQALAQVLCGRAAPPGRLPVSIPGLYPLKSNG